LETSVDSPAGVQDAAEPVAQGVAAVHIDVEKMEVHEEGNEQQGDEQQEGDKEGEG